jgi:hypothetical protein
MIRFAFCLLFFVAFQAANAQFYLAENASFFLSDGSIMRFSAPVFLDALSVLQNDGVWHHGVQSRRGLRMGVHASWS